MSAREHERIAQAGADVLRICQTSVQVVCDEPAWIEPWNHPVWPLCRALGALGFARVVLRGAEAYDLELEELMHGFPFVHEPALADGSADPEDPCDVVVHLGGDVASRESSARLAEAHSSAFISVGWEDGRVEMRSLAGLDAVAPGPPAPPRAELLPAAARIAAGLALQEVLVLVGELEGVGSPDPLVCFDVAAGAPVRPPLDPWRPRDMDPAVIDVMGAGGVGTHLLECLTPALGPCCEVRIFDFDHVSPENLALQAAFSSSDVGVPKAIAMAAKLAPRCDPTLALRPVVARWEERCDEFGPPSLRVACPDSFAARVLANDRALADGIPLVEAGSSPLAAQQRSYVPGVTACLEHRIPHLRERARQEQDRASCAEQRAFTLPGTNMICAGLLAAEALRALEPQSFGPPSRGTLVYDARFPQRFGAEAALPPCDHRTSR